MNGVALIGLCMFGVALALHVNGVYLAKKDRADEEE